jgi:hypothetical protein
VKLQPLLEASTPKQVIELQSDVLDGLHDSSWDVNLADSELQVTDGQDVITYDYDSRIIKSSAFSDQYEVEHAEHTSPKIIEYAAITDAYKQLKHLLADFKLKVKLDDNSDYSLIIIAYQGKSERNFEVRVEVSFEEGEWHLSYESEYESLNPSFEKFSQLMHFLKGVLE